MTHRHTSHACPLILHNNVWNHYCDVCKRQLTLQEQRYSCGLHDYDVCANCMKPPSLTDTLRAVAAPLGYSVVAVSWEDCSRGFTASGQLSSMGSNITDVRIADRERRPIYTVRAQNWNERVAFVPAADVSLVVGNEEPTAHKALRSVALSEYLARIGTFGSYAGVPAGTSLAADAIDARLTVRFQTVFVAKDSEFTTNVYSYGGTDANPQNLLLYCTAQGTSIDTAAHGNVFLHMRTPGGKTETSWLQARASEFKVGGAQAETAESAAAAAAAGSAVAAQMGIRAMGTRCNVVMLIQVPLKQPEPRPAAVFSLGAPAPQPVWKGGAFSFGAAAACAVMKCDQDGAPAATRGQERSRGCDGSRGISSAARVSKGTTESTDWPGIAQNKNWERHPSAHPTITVTMYYAVDGGVPTDADVRAAIADLEALYAALGTGGRLADLGASGVTDAPAAPTAFTFGVPV